MAYTLVPSNLLASDLVQYSDAELDQYLEANGRHVQVDDPENLSSDFIQRLRSRTGADATAQPRSIDLNYVSARLIEEPANRETSPRSPSSSATSVFVDDEEFHRSCQEKEIEYYNELINDGGRASHPISVPYDVAQSLPEYHEIISFWQIAPGHRDNWKVFGRQLFEWERFREHQIFERQRGFPVYCERLYRCLKRHECEWSFQLTEKPDQQHKLATWIEFLSYEYWRHDKSANIVARHRSRHDEGWKKLVDSKVLHSFETEDSIWTFGIGLQMKNEEIEAKDAVESATATMQSAEKILLKTQSASLSKLSSSLPEQKLFAARSALANATKSLELISRRRKFIVDFQIRTKAYRIARDAVASQSILLRWIIQQISSIDFELNIPKVTDNDSTGEEVRRQRNLKRKHIDDGDENSASKQQRKDDASHSMPEAQMPSSSVQCPSLSRSPANADTK